MRNLPDMLKQHILQYYPLRYALNWNYSLWTNCHNAMFAAVRCGNVKIIKKICQKLKIQGCTKREFESYLIMAGTDCYVNCVEVLLPYCDLKGYTEYIIRWFKIGGCDKCLDLLYQEIYSQRHSKKN